MKPCLERSCPCSKIKKRIFLINSSKADPERAPFTALKYKELGLLISAREVDLPISLRLTDSVKH